MDMGLIFGSVLYDWVLKFSIINYGFGPFFGGLGGTPVGSFQARRTSNMHMKQYNVQTILNNLSEVGPKSSTVC